MRLSEINPFSTGSFEVWFSKDLGAIRLGQDQAAGTLGGSSALAAEVSQEFWPENSQPRKREVIKFEPQRDGGTSLLKVAGCTMPPIQFDRLLVGLRK